MKKESLGDKYKKSLIRIRKLEEDKKALTERISKLSTLLVSMDLLLGKKNVEIQKLKYENMLNPLEAEIERLGKALNEIEIRSDKILTEFNCIKSCQINLQQIYELIQALKEE